MMKFKVDGKRIQSLRKKKGWTQSDLGIKQMEANGFKKISIRTIQKIENDPEYRCSIKVIGNLAKIFDVKDSEIVNAEKIKEEINKIDEGKKTIEDEFNVKLGQKNLAIEDKKDFRPDAEKSELLEESKKNKKESIYDEWFLSPEKVGEVDYSRKFSIDEGMIGCLNRWIDFKYEIEAWVKFNKHIRQLKLVPTAFGEIVSFFEIPNQKDEKWMFRALCEAEAHSKASWSERYGVIDQDTEIYSGTTTFKRDYSKIAYNHGVPALFEFMKDVNYFTIHSLIPDEEETYEIVYGIVDSIEKYFAEKPTLAEEFKYKYNISSLKKRLSSKKIGLFYRNWSEKELISDKNSNYMYRKSVFAKIFIIRWSDQNVLDSGRFVDTNYQLYSTYNKTWIKPEESENENESYVDIKNNDPEGNSLMKNENTEVDYVS